MTPSAHWEKGQCFWPRAFARIIAVFWPSLAFGLCLSPLLAFAGPQSEHIVYFHHTPYELNIYKIHGRHPGPTLMLIGGIQGNEPGGFLSADLYADMALERGNLIVVPRANFNSILQCKRGANGDMNRMFASKGKGYPEHQIVAILKSLIAGSDCLLNLHDGSGYYSPHWQSSQVNPLRYGQSIIADAERYYSRRLHRWLELKAMAERVLARVNPRIPQARYRFSFNNHRTAEPDTLHPEQRKSATYYALTVQGIPAFGVETSKNLPSTEMKVRQHNLVINAFMKELGILPETPPVNLEPPRLDYLVIAVNGGLPVAVRPRQTLHLQHGDSAEVVHIEANYERGLSADILGLGCLNDLRKPFTIRGSTDIVVRKDHLECGRIHLVVGPAGLSPPLLAASGLPRLGFIIKINGCQYFYENDSRVHLVAGDLLEVVNVLLPANLAARLKVNVKGFISNPDNNTGEDRGFVIDTAKDLLRRHSLGKQGRHYLVLAQTTGGRLLGRLHLLVDSPRFRYVVACINGCQKRWYQPGETIELQRRQSLQIVDIQTNMPEREALVLQCSLPAFSLGNNWQEKVLHFADLFAGFSGASGPVSFGWTVKRGSLSLGQIFVRISP